MLYIVIKRQIQCRVGLYIMITPTSSRNQMALPINGLDCIIKIVGALYYKWLWLSNLREFVQLPSSWPPAHVEGGVRATLHYVILAGSGGSGGLAGSGAVPKPSVSSTRNAHF